MDESQSSLFFCFFRIKDIMIKLIFELKYFVRVSCFFFFIKVQMSDCDLASEIVSLPEQVTFDES
jgi:hypothetical protein